MNSLHSPEAQTGSGAPRPKHKRKRAFVVKRERAALWRLGGSQLCFDGKLRLREQGSPGGVAEKFIEAFPGRPNDILREKRLGGRAGDETLRCLVRLVGFALRPAASREAAQSSSSPVHPRKSSLSFVKFMYVFPLAWPFKRLFVPGPSPPIYQCVVSLTIYLSTLVANASNTTDLASTIRPVSTPTGPRATQSFHWLIFLVRRNSSADRSTESQGGSGRVVPFFMATGRNTKKTIDSLAEKPDGAMTFKLPNPL